MPSNLHDTARDQTFGEDDGQTFDFWIVNLETEEHILCGLIVLNVG